MAVALEHSRYKSSNRRKYRNRRIFLLLVLTVTVVALIGFALAKMGLTFGTQNEAILDREAGDAAIAIIQNNGFSDKLDVQFAHQSGAGGGEAESSKHGVGESQQPGLPQQGEQSSGAQSQSQAAEGSEANKDASSGTANSDTEANMPVEKEPKYIALTFDDGPDPHYTTAILDILKDKGVKATFFVVGIQVKKFPEVLQRMVDEGHSIGNHSQSHADLSKKTKAQIKKDIDFADQLIEETIGFKPVLFRAPYGAVSNTLKDVIESTDRQMIGWTIDTRDWAGTTPADMRAMIQEKAESGSIVLMHSFGGKHIVNTVEALPSIIDDLLADGYTPVTIEELP